MAGNGLGIVIALGIGIVATLAVLLFNPSSPRAHEYQNRQRTRDYDQPNSWSQTTNRRNVRQKSRKQNASASKNKESLCAICMTEDNQELISLQCSHEFHKLCIVSWHKESPTCPICRSPFRL